MWEKGSISAKNRQRSPLLAMLALFFTIMLLIGSSMILYAAVYVPSQVDAHATSTALTQATQMAKANATDLAQEVATTTAISIATATALNQLQHDYQAVTSTAPAVNDSLQAQSGADWNNYENCAFTGGSYHATSSEQKTITLCFALNTHVSDFAFQVHMNILQGDSGGIVFRANVAKSQNYLLKISTNGTYELDYYPDDSGKTAQALASDASPLLKTDYHQDNTICVIARGDTMNFYFNGQYAMTVKDASLSTGQIGVIADDSTNPTNVAYSQAQLWRL